MVFVCQNLRRAQLSQREEKTSASKIIRDMPHCYCIVRFIKERESIYIAPFMYYVCLKALRHGSHSFTCKYTMTAFLS